jgi:hypothetical protein
MNELTEALQRSRISVSHYFRSRLLARWFLLRDRRSADRRVRIARQARGAVSRNRGAERRAPILAPRQDRSNLLLTSSEKPCELLLFRSSDEIGPHCAADPLTLHMRRQQSWPRLRR